MANKRPPGNRPPNRRPSPRQPEILVHRGNDSQQVPQKRQPPPQQGRRQQPSKKQSSRSRNEAEAQKRRRNSRNGAEIQQQRRSNQIDATQRRRRKRYKRNYTLHYILLAIFLLVTGTTLSLTVFFNISSITVTGTGYYSATQVQEVLEAKAGDNLLRLNVDALEETMLEKLVHAESVKIRRKLPETLAVEVIDGVVTRQLYQDGLYYMLSKGGRMVEKASTPIPNIPIIVGTKTDTVEEGAWIQDVLTKEENDSLTIISNEIEQSGLKDIPVINISNLIDIRIYYQNRMEIKLGSFSELSDKLAAVYTIFERGDVGVEEHGVIDATDADRIIINNQTEPEMPEGISPEGWTWEDPFAIPEEDGADEGTEGETGEGITDGTEEGEKEGESSSTESSSLTSGGS